MTTSRTRVVHRGTPDVSLVFPVYNPGPRLLQTLDALGAFSQSTDRHWEFVFVCDGCTDDSVELIRSWRPGNNSSQLLEYSPNRGKGFAVRQGMLAAAAPVRIFTDIDLAYSFDNIVQIAQALHSGADAVIASRNHPESHIQIKTGMVSFVFRRHLQSQAFSFLAQMLLPLRQKDTQAGLKGLSETAVRMIMPRLACDGFGFDCELLTACARLGLEVTEIPVNVRYDHAASTTSLISTFRMIAELFRIRKRWPKSMAIEPQAPSMTFKYREAG